MTLLEALENTERRAKRYAIKAALSIIPSQRKAFEKLRTESEREAQALKIIKAREENFNV